MVDDQDDTQEQPDPTPHAASNFNPATDDQPIEPDELGNALIGGAVTAAAAPLISAATDVIAPAAESLIGDEAGSLGNGQYQGLNSGAIQRLREQFGLSPTTSAEEVMNTAAQKGIGGSDIASSTSAAGVPKPSAIPKGSFRPKRLADGGNVSSRSDSTDQIGAEVPLANPPQLYGHELSFADGGSTSIEDNPTAITQDAAASAPQSPPMVAPQAPEQTTAPEPGVPMYDISGPTPVFGHMDHPQVQDAITSGKFSLPKGSTIPAMGPDGKLWDLSADDAPQAFQNGYTYASPATVNQYTYGSTGNQIGAGIEGLAQSVAGPLATAAERAIGVPAEDIRGRAEANPWTHGIAETAGLVGGVLTGVGEGAVLADAGELAAKVLGPQSESILAKIGARGISDATQMALYQGGDELSKMIEGDPTQTVGSAMTDVGLSGIIGGIAGGALGTISPLWKATVGDSASQLAADFKGRLAFLDKNGGDLGEALTKEMTDHYNGVKSAADEVYGPQGIKAKGVTDAMPEMSSEISNQAQEFANDMQNRIKKMVADQYSYPPRLTVKLQADLDNYMAKVTDPAVQPVDIFNAGQDLKQQLQGYSKFDKILSPIDEGYDFVKDSKDMAHNLRQGLEDPEVWGKAGTLQQKINGAFTDYLPALKDFESKFTTKVGGEPQVDAGKIQTYLNQLGKPSSNVRKQVLDNFLDASEKYKKVISDVHAGLGSESPIQPSSLEVANSTLQKQTTGSKLADYLVKTGINHVLGETAGTATGAAAGQAFGAPGFGAIVGERALGPFFKSVLNGIAKPIMTGAANGGGLKAAFDLATAAARGDNLMGKAAKNLFKASGEVVSGSLLSDSRKRDKLDAQLQKFQENPEKMTQVTNNDVGHYMPQHAAAIGTTTAQAVNYLNNLRPRTSPALPLDSKLPPNPVTLAAYHSALDIANQPLTVIDKIHHGMLTPQDVATLNAVNPGAYKNLSGKVMQELMTHVSKGNTVPYKTRVQLSMFLGEPLDSTMTPAGIIAAQPIAQQNQPQTPTAPASKPKRSTSKLGDQAKSAMTAGQARQARQDKVS